VHMISFVQALMGLALCQRHLFLSQPGVKPDLQTLRALLLGDLKDGALPPSAREYLSLVDWLEPTPLFLKIATVFFL